MTTPNHDALSGRPEDSPFGSERRSSGRRLIRFGIWIVLLAAALILVRLSTKKATTVRADGGHPSGQATTAADSAHSVTLSPNDARRIGVTFAQVTRAPLERIIRTVAQVTYDETRVSVVSLRVDGWIERLYADFTGKAVRGGEPLLDVYSPMAVTTERELLLAKHLTAALAGGDPEALARAQGLVDAARRRLTAWEIPDTEIRRLEQTGQITKTITIDAPSNGTVVEKSVFAGQNVMAGAPLFKLADLTQVWLEGEVFEQDLPAVHVGQLVSAEFQALPGEQRTGQVTYVSPTLNSETRTARARVVLRNPDLRLKPGMFGTIRFSAPTATTTLSVPRSALLATGERNLVFVRRPDGRFTPRDVVLGASTEDRVEVLKGLEAGETVVASGTFLVDAESNLGTLMGGMGDMPGMDVTAPGKAKSPPRGSTKPDSAMRDMPGVERPKRRE